MSAAGDDQRRTGQLRRFIEDVVLPRTWYVLTPVVLVLSASPGVCIQTMVTASKPSTQRLHLRNLFAQGRRYQIDPRTTSFRMMTTRKDAWRYRRRTSSATMLYGDFDSLGDDLSQLTLTARVKVAYLGDSFLWPTFMTSLLVFMPWNPFLIAAFVAALYGLSWGGHRANARLEADDMVWFIQKALEDYAAEVKELASEHVATVPSNQDFAQVWERFMDEVGGAANDSPGDQSR